MKTDHPARLMKPTALAMALLLASAAVSAQSTESLSVPVGTVQGDKPAAPAEVDYVVPDLKTKPNGGMHQVNDYFSFKPSLALLEDFTYIDQDADSIAQVGDQASQWQVRSARLTFLGSIGKDYKVSYQFGGEYKGFDTDPVQSWQLTDLSFTFPIGGPNNKLTVGKTKETFNYEMVGDAANLPHSERVLSPFFVSRNMGVKMLHVFGEKKTMTLSYGVFNDTWDINSTSSRGMDYTARVTGLVWDVPEKQQFLHLGLALREVGADGTLRYRGRPESNVTDYYVDTGNMPADGAFQYGLEALWNSGPFSVLAEYNHATIDSPTLNDPEFKGYYITGSWVITGETRPYDRNVGYARRVIPTGRWGAPELVVRYSNLDLDDNTVQGGAFEKTYLGLNWWATKRWKFGIGWGRTWLDKNGVTGVTDAVLSRIQWVY